VAEAPPTLAPAAATPAPPAAKPAAPRPAAAAGAATAATAKKKARPEPAPRKATGTAVAAAAPEARKPSGDPLLDAADVDADFERQLQGGAKPKRSVYVPPAPGSDLPDKLTESQIQEGVASRIDSLKQCVTQQQAKSPDLHGTLRLQWTILGDGSVSGVKVQSPELAGEPISGCIASVVRSIRFPRSRTTGQAVSFPFAF
jgi:hypothetical protein